MKVVVIGAGIIGLASARFLLEEGVHDITVVDRAAGPTQGTSFANGALLHPSAVEPWNSPGILGVLLRSLGREDAAVLLRARAVPSLLGWGWRFLRESAPQRFRANTMANCALALHSLRCMRQLGIDPAAFDHAGRGSLMVLREPIALDKAVRWAAELAQAGVRYRVLDRREMVALEPALAPVAEQFVGAVHNLDDETGDCHRYGVALAEQLSKAGVSLRLAACVERIEADRQGVRGVRLAGGETLPADAVVLAAASPSVALARALGLALPVRPAKGYSLTYELGADAPLPQVPVIDSALHVAVTPLGEGATRRLRVAGTAEFCGDDLSICATRAAQLARLAARLYPSVLGASGTSRPREWTGLRPVCADGRPLIGPTRVPGLWLNTGHGHMGWTVGAASGHLLARQMIGADTGPVDARAFAPTRLGL